MCGNTQGGDSPPLTRSPFGITIIPEHDVYRLVMRSKLLACLAVHSAVHSAVHRDMIRA